MQFASALSREVETEAAVADVIEQVAPRLAEQHAHLSFVFASPQHLKAFPRLLHVLQERFSSHTLIGCTGGGVIGNRHEVENQPALALMVAHLPGVNIMPFHIEQHDLDEGWAETYWQNRLGASPEDEPTLILLPDPFMIDPQRLLDVLNTAYPLRPVLGGLASGGRSQSSCALFLNGEVVHGAVGVALTGNVTVRTVVSQGCKPVGSPFIITRCEEQVIYELSGKPALEAVRDAIGELPPEDQELARTALLMGRVIDEYKDEFTRGDFLIRTFLGADPRTGAIAVGDTFRAGQTVQLHVRDATTAREDLHALMGTLSVDLAGKPAQGALLFSCNGRGAHLYGEPDYDSRVVAETTGAIPTAGFFCNGEIGPIGTSNFLHGFTASVGIFQEKP